VEPRIAQQIPARQSGYRRRGVRRSRLLTSIVPTPAVFLALLGLPVAAQTSSSEPRFEVAQREIHLGELTRIERATGRFEIRNTGTGDLEILSAAPG
jgi:hypothetical protein